MVAFAGTSHIAPVADNFADNWLRIRRSRLRSSAVSRLHFKLFERQMGQESQLHPAVLETERPYMLYIASHYIQTRSYRGRLATQKSGQISGQSTRLEDGMSSSVCSIGCVGVFVFPYFACSSTRSTALRFAVGFAARHWLRPLIDRIGSLLHRQRPDSVSHPGWCVHDLLPLGRLDAPWLY